MKDFSGFHVVRRPCSNVVGYWRFGGPCCWHLLTLKMRAWSSETSVSCHITTRHHSRRQRLGSYCLLVMSSKSVLVYPLKVKVKLSLCLA